MSKQIVPVGIVLLALTSPAFAAIPVPEPSSLSILAVGAVALGGLQLFRRNKRKD